MSNSIWKTPEESPRQEQLVAWVDRNGMHAGRFDTCYNCFCACADYRADLRKAKKWCSLENLENLIAQADKAERLQKAVDLALERFDDIRRLYNKYYDKYSVIATETTEEIKQIIKDN